MLWPTYRVTGPLFKARQNLVLPREVSLFGLSARFSVPACEIDTAPRTAAVKTGRKATIRREAVLTAARTARGSIRLGAPLPYSGCAEAILESNNRSSAGYRPATLPLDSLVGSLAAPDPRFSGDPPALGLLGEIPSARPGVRAISHMMTLTRQ